MRNAVALVPFLVVTGCLPLRWTPQAVTGQVDLLLHRVPLERAAADTSTPPAVRALLREVPRVKRWGTLHGLKATSNYAHYVALDRGAVAYVVSAAPPLELRAVTWRFPVVGDVPYVGWFSRRDALQHAAMLALEGLDVSMRPVEAYSTLGWLPDPVLSSMVVPGPLSRAHLVNTVLHESVHATVFVPGGGAFNETLASVVADVLTPIYLRELDGARGTELPAWEDANVRWEQRRGVLVEAHAALEQLYAGPGSHAEKLRRKHALLWKLLDAVPSARPWNNASLMQFRTYDTGTAVFRDALGDCGDDVGAFLRGLAGLENAPPMEPVEALRKALRSALAASCAATRTHKDKDAP